MPVYALDDVSPWAASDGVAIQWGTGWAAYVLASSQCVRLTQRGIHAKPAFWTPVHNLRGSGWTVRPCRPGAAGICTGANWTAFPVPPRRPVYTPHLSATDYGRLGCTRDEDGRTLDALAAVYEPSPCDVMDGGWDVLVTGHSIAFKHTAMDTWAYWTLCILIVCVVRALTHLVAARFHGTEPPHTPQPDAPTRTDRLLSAWMRTSHPRTAAACLLIWALCVIPSHSTLYVTAEEQLLHTGIALYIPAYVLLWGMSTHTEDPPLYNMIIASVLLATTRLYMGAETPYVPVLTWAIGTRTLMKIQNTYWSRIVAVTIMLDAFLLSITTVLGLTCDPPYQILIGTLTLVAADTLQIA